MTAYDKTTTDDGDAFPNGILSGGTVGVASAPDGASWVMFVRLNDTQLVVSARRIASNETLSPLGGKPLQTTEFGAAADLTGRVMIAVQSGARGRMVVIPVATARGSRRSGGGSTCRRPPIGTSRCAAWTRRTTPPR